MSRGLIVDDQEAVAKVSRAYDRLRAEVLSARDSARLIRAVMRGLNNVTNSRMPVIHPNRHADWKKSSHSEGDGGNCVEVALNLAVSGVVPVRDSKDRSGPALGISASGWESFIAAVQAGEFGEV